ncbi:MAG TPA: tetratricopeptide repeat protein [Gillisia sp.]|nr:tetratricopeptide repeat protein [Gillisia sp.]
MRCFVYISLWLLTSSSIFAQNEQLGQNYLDQGEYEKALKTYQQLVKDNPGNSTYFYGLVTAHQELEDFSSAESLLKDRLKNTLDNPNVYIELGHNFNLQQKKAEAASHFDQAIELLKERPNYTYSVARTFEKYSLLDYAIRAYRMGMELNPEMKFDLQLARLYGEQGKLDQMFTSYLDLMEKEPELSYNLVREFDRYITEDATSPANSTLRKLLLQRLQKNPDLLYNEMLAWLFSQQKEFNRAFAQEKAIYRRNNNDLQRIIQLTVMSKAEGDLETAKDIVSFIIDESPSANILLQANQLLLDMKIATAKKGDHSGIKKDFQKLFEQFGYGRETLALQVDYANFLAFQMEETSEAIKVLDELSAKELSDFEQARVKMTLGDVLLMEEKFNRALIFYSQVQNLVKNDELAQEARFKVARTSYFKGDFEWAKTQLDVLKASSTQLIANDAMELSLLIQDNSVEDSTQTALKKYARADLLAFQNKNTEAIRLLGEILQQHPAEKIEDEALLKQAELYEEEENWTNAEANYLKILQHHYQDILADNATWRLAELYNNHLNNPEKAKDYYEEIIFNFPDSIYFVEARRNFRQLRGDAVK